MQLAQADSATLTDFGLKGRRPSAPPATVSAAWS
jgi:hypothetical protein